MSRVADKIVLITGAARGQGRTHALTLAREGAHIAAVDLGDQRLPGNLTMTGTLSDLESTVKQVQALGQRAIALVADISQEDQVKAAVDSTIAEFGRIDVVVANAAVFDVPKPLWECRKEEWDALLATDLTGPWLTIKHIAPHMLGRGEGSIIVISSSAGIKPMSYMGSYSVAKAGLRGLVKVAANELGPQGIRVNSVHPSAVDTPGLRAMMDMAGMDHDAGIKQFLDDQIIPRIVRDQDVANAVLFLASDESLNITGTELSVDGGWITKG